VNGPNNKSRDQVRRIFERGKSVWRREMKKDEASKKRHEVAGYGSKGSGRRMQKMMKRTRKG
jgi:hypothetical protein